jgi:hypothetical protein
MSEVKSKKAKVGGKTITIFQAQGSFVLELQRSIAMANASNEIPKIYAELNLDEQVVTYVHHLLYPSLVTCSKGQLPSEEDFVGMSEPEVKAWTDPAQLLNPDWFSFLNGEARDEQEKKE